MGSLVTSTPAKIMAVSEIPGSLVANCWGGRWCSCRYTWSFSGPTPLRDRQRGRWRKYAVETSVREFMWYIHKSHWHLTLSNSSNNHTPALSDLYGHGAGHDVSGGQVFGVGCIALHEALPLTVDQDATLTTAALCDQAPSSIDPYMKNSSIKSIQELHFHVSEWKRWD